MAARQLDLSAGRTHRGVVQVIRTRILDGSIRPGDALRLNALADDLGVSATPVREALLMLAQDGWLAHEPHRGFVVRHLRRIDVDDVYGMWAYAEGEVTARAALRATPEHIAEMRRVDGVIRALPDGATQEALRLNDDFHDTIHEASDSPKLVWFVDAARRVAPFRVSDSFEQVPGWAEVNRTQHAPIIDAIEARDPDAARAAARHHLLTAGRLLVEWLDGMDFWSNVR